MTILSAVMENHTMLTNGSAAITYCTENEGTHTSAVGTALTIPVLIAVVGGAVK